MMEPKNEEDLRAELAAAIAFARRSASLLFEPASRRASGRLFSAIPARPASSSSASGNVIL